MRCTHDSVILPQLQIVRQIPHFVPVRAPAAGVGEILDIEAFLDQVVVEERVGLAVFACEADFGRASVVVCVRWWW